MYMCIVSDYRSRGRQKIYGINSIRQGRAPQRTTTTECTPMLCMVLFQ